MYSQLTTDEIAKLSTNKASGAAWAVYTALSAHAWTKATVFPSIQRISDVLANAYSHRAIYRALVFLEKVGLIVRKASTVKERFTLVLKQAAKKAKEKIKEAAAAKKDELTDLAQSRQSWQYKKRTEKERLINQSKLKKQQQIKNNHFPDYERPPVHEWLEECLLYIEGTRKEKPSKICRQTAENALKSNDAVACLIVEGGHKEMALSLL